MGCRMQTRCVVSFLSLFDLFVYLPFCSFILQKTVQYMYVIYSICYLVIDNFCTLFFHIFLFPSTNLFLTSGAIAFIL